MENQLEEGISIGELFAIVWKKKIFIAIATVLTAIIFVLVVVFGLNPNSLKYEASFELQFPGLINNKYPSGYLFNYNDIISDKNIEEVISSNDKFKNINIDEFNNETISIKETTSSSNTSKMYRNFSISVNGSLFNNQDDAASFVEMLVSATYNRVVNSVNDLSFSSYLENAQSAETFELQLSLLNQQVTYINNSYDTLIEEFGDVSINGDTLLNHQTKFNSYFATNSISNLISELNNSTYVKDYEKNKDLLIVRRDILTSDITLLTNQIEALTDIVEGLLSNSSGSTTPDIDSYNAQIAKLTIEKVSLEYDRDMLNEKIDKGNTESAIEASTLFLKKIESIQDVLQEFINDYESNVKGVYDQFTYITFDSRSIVKSSGTISFVLAGMVGAVMAGGISCVVFIALDFIGNKKEESDKIEA